MKYIKDYYTKDDYKQIVKYFFKLFVKENFLRISKRDYYNIFAPIIDDISIMLKHKEIKSDKKLFSVIRINLISLMENNEIIKNEIERQNFYKKSFKSDDYFNYNGFLNHNYFLLEVKDEFKYIK